MIHPSEETVNIIIVAMKGKLHEQHHHAHISGQHTNDFNTLNQINKTVNGNVNLGNTGKNIEKSVENIVTLGTSVTGGSINIVATETYCEPNNIKTNKKKKKSAAGKAINRMKDIFTTWLHQHHQQTQMNRNCHNVHHTLNDINSLNLIKFIEKIIEV